MVAWSWLFSCSNDVISCWRSCTLQFLGSPQRHSLHNCTVRRTLSAIENGRLILVVLLFSNNTLFVPTSLSRVFLTIFHNTFCTVGGNPNAQRQLLHTLYSTTYRYSVQRQYSRIVVARSWLFCTTTGLSIIPTTFFLYSHDLRRFLFLGSPDTHHHACSDEASEPWVYSFCVVYTVVRTGLVLVL